MNIKDYGPGIYTLFRGELPAEMKIYSGWKHIGWQPVIIKHVMLRATDRTGYYIIKGSFGRVDAVNAFRAYNQSLKSYLQWRQENPEEAALVEAP